MKHIRIFQLPIPIRPIHLTGFSSQILGFLVKRCWQRSAQIIHRLDLSQHRSERIICQILHPGGRAFHQSPCQSPSSAREGDSGGFDSRDKCIKLGPPHKSPGFALYVYHSRLQHVLFLLVVHWLVIVGFHGHADV